MCVWGPEANSTRLCIHYLPRCQHYRVIARGDRVNVYHRKRFSWSKITAETEHVVPVSAGADKLSPSATDAIVLCDVNLWEANYLYVTGAVAAKENLSVVLLLQAAAFSHLVSRKESNGEYVNTWWLIWMSVPFTLVNRVTWGQWKHWECS